MANKKNLTGYPSIDKPWLEFYDKERLAEKNYIKRTVYEELVYKNKNYPKELAIEYFGSKISFGKFFEKIDDTAKALVEFGIKKGDFITICAAGIPETAYTFYAASKLGAVANMISPFFDKEQLVERIADCESDLMIIMDKFYPLMKEAIKKSRIKKIVVLPTLNSSLLGVVSKKYPLEKNSNEVYWNTFIKAGRHRENVTSVKYEEQLPLAMVYSSGSTGASKGILLSNDSFQNSMHAYYASGMDTTRGQKLYQIIPTWFSTGLSTSLHLPLSYGISVFMDPRFERKVFINNIYKSKANYTVAPTSMYEAFLDESLVKNKSLAFFNYPFEGGEPLKQEVAEKIEKVFKAHGNNAKLRMAYGQCECGAAITTQTQKMEASDNSCGIPLPGITVSIFDDEFNELKYNEKGHVLVDTPNGMIGYYKNEEATNEYFCYINGVKWSNTGDIGYLNERGELFVQGRASDYSVVNDKKIYNFDIENILMNIEHIKMCDVLAKKNSNNVDSMVAHIVFDEEYYNQVKDNSELLLSKLSEIQNQIYIETNDSDMVPTIFKIRETFPYAKSGKRDVFALKNETEDFIELDRR